MTDNLIKAKDMLEGHTCVLFNGEKTYTSTDRGVKPLLGFVDKSIDLKGYSAADKVVGKGAAMLYVILGIKEIYTTLISVPAKEIFEKNNIAVYYDLCVPAIQNRDKTGFCPIESAVMEIDNPQIALEVIKNKLKYLKK